MQLRTCFLGGFIVCFFFLSTNFLLFIYLFIFIYFLNYLKCNNTLVIFFNLYWCPTHTNLMARDLAPEGGFLFFCFFVFFLNTLVILIQDGNTTNFYSSISQYTTASGISQYTTRLYEHVPIHFYNILVMYERVQTCALTLIFKFKG